MPQSTSVWTAQATARYKPILIALAALAAGCTLYFIHGQSSSDANNGKSSSGLHRSSSVRRPRRRRVVPRSQDHPRAENEEESTTRPDQVEVGSRRFSDRPWTDLPDPSQNATMLEDSAVSDMAISEDGDENAVSEGQSLLTLLYRIAEEQTRRDGYIHRGVQCNSCNENPIRGIRYRCFNCADYDLCEQCEAMQTHPKTHLFYKIRIPAPFIGAHKERQPVLYPGKPKFVTQTLTKERIDKFGRDSGFKSEEIEALWEQFRCMAAAEYPNDPEHYHLAIDRATFDRCFLPGTASEQPRPNLIYDRLFSYYDTNHDGLVGFAEFIAGLSSLRKKNLDARLKRLFNGYDVDGDGFIERRDILRIFNAYYELTKELTADVIAGLQDDADDGNARDLVMGGQPLSSAFSGPIPRGDDSRAGQGKRTDALGRLVIHDGRSVMNVDESQDGVDFEGIIADNAERAVFKLVNEETQWSGMDLSNFIYKAEWSHIAAKMARLNINLENFSARENPPTAAREHLRLVMVDDIWRRRLVRRRAVMRRAQRQYFMDTSAEKVNGQINFPLEAGGLLADPRLHTRMGKDLTELRLSGKRVKDFGKDLDEVIEDLYWPVDDRVHFRNTLLKLISSGWTEKALEEDLNIFDEGPERVSAFVYRMSQLLNQAAGVARKDPDFKDEFKKVEPIGRSRSSSKVRFEDGVGGGDDDEEETRSVTSTSSRSRPTNERWGGFDIPEPESDVGRESLIRVAQEAINEVLDPIFRLREDLGLHALFTRKSRKRHREPITMTMKRDVDLWRLWTYIDMYQRKWREANDWPEGRVQPHRNEVDNFQLFIQQMEQGAMSELTGQSCPECLSRGRYEFVRFGQKCTGIDHPSGTASAKDPNGQPRPINSKFCRHYNVSDSQGSIQILICDDCHVNCPDLQLRLNKLRETVVSMPGNEDGSDLRTDETSFPGQSEAQENSNGQAVEGDHDTKSDGGNKETKDREQTEDPEQESEQHDHEPHHQEQEIDGQGMTDDLHASVAAFDEGDVDKVEKNIASTALPDLLAASGYSAATSTPSSPKSTREALQDLPHSKGRDDSAGDSSLTPPREEEDISPVDPTLPQHRPNSINEVAPDPSSPYPQQSRAPLAHVTSSNDKQAEHTTSPTSSTTKKLTPDLNSTTDTTTDPNTSSQTPSPVPSQFTCRFWAALDIIEAEDEERGGPGRLSYDEFVEVMKGAKGASLGLLASWIEVVGSF